MRTLLWVWLVLAAGTVFARDLLVGTNGEQFVGTVISETASNVVFDSEMVGRQTFPRAKIRIVQRTPPVAVSPAATVLATTTNSPATNAPVTAAWHPPGVGRDGSDWVQLRSGEWLKGTLRYIQNKEVDFDSDEMDEQTLKLKNVSKVYPAQPMFIQFADQPSIYGRVVISNDLVRVEGSQPVSLPRDQLLGITPSGGRTGIRDWSGDFDLGLSVQSGNNEQTTLTTSAELARRTPNTSFLINYLGNYSQVNNVQSANSQRLNSTYDLRLNHDWFLRPIQLEYYQDSLANLAHRVTAGVGAGYYVLDRDELEWTVSAGPGYQATWFENVKSGESDTATTPAAVLGSNFKADLTQRVTLIQSWQSMFIDRQSGSYNHHAVTTCEFEVKRHLDLDVSFIWDYLQNPEAKDDGVVPQKSDYYLTLGFGVRF